MVWASLLNVVIIGLDITDNVIEMVFDHAEFALTLNLVFLSSIALIFLLKPDPLCSQLHPHGEGLTERFDLERGATLLVIVKDVRAKRLLEVKEFKLGLFIVINFWVFLIFVYGLSAWQQATALYFCQCCSHY